MFEGTQDRHFLEAGSSLDEFDSLLERLTIQRRLHYCLAGIPVVIALIALLTLFFWWESIPESVVQLVLLVSAPWLIIFAAVVLIKAVAIGTQVKLLLFCKGRLMICEDKIEDPK